MSIDELELTPSTVTTLIKPNLCFETLINCFIFQQNPEKQCTHKQHKSTYEIHKVSLTCCNSHAIYVVIHMSLKLQVTCNSCCNSHVIHGIKFSLAKCDPPYQK